MLPPDELLLELVLLVDELLELDDELELVLLVLELELELELLELELELDDVLPQLSTTPQLPF